MIDGEDIFPPEHHVIRSSAMVPDKPPQRLTRKEFRLIEQRANRQRSHGAGEILEWASAQPGYSHITLTMVHYVLKYVRRPQTTPLPEALR